jgi:putative GTP pyrophosphokinase
MTFESEYNELILPYQEFLDAMLRNIGKLVRDNNIPLAFDPYGRLKDLESIQEKHYSGRFRVKRSITELNDLVGIRMVVLFPEYVDKLRQLIESEFKVRDIKQIGAEDDRFSYSSLHMIIGIKDEWKTALDWRGHEGRKLELQIRSLSEHIWAETSHTLFYKAESNIPAAVKRDNSRLKALLEVVDDKLQDLKNRTETYFKSIRTRPYDEVLELDLNPHTLRRILENFESDIAYGDREFAALNARIEREYNILSAGLLDKIIAGEIKDFDRSKQSIAEFVVEMLERRKRLIAEAQRLKEKLDNLDDEIKKLEAAP